jgi:hypothetical protein
MTERGMCAGKSKKRLKNFSGCGIVTVIDIDNGKEGLTIYDFYCAISFVPTERKVWYSFFTGIFGGMCFVCALYDRK